MLRALERTVDAYLGSADPELNAVVQQIRDLVPAFVKRLGEVCWLETQSHQSAAAKDKIKDWHNTERTMRDAANSLAPGWISSGVRLSTTDVACLQGVVKAITDAVAAEGGSANAKAVLTALQTVISKNTHGV